MIKRWCDNLLGIHIYVGIQILFIWLKYVLFKEKNKKTKQNKTKQILQAKQIATQAFMFSEQQTSKIS